MFIYNFCLQRLDNLFEVLLNPLIARECNSVLRTEQFRVGIATIAFKMEPQKFSSLFTVILVRMAAI